MFPSQTLLAQACAFDSQTSLCSVSELDWCCSALFADDQTPTFSNKVENIHQLLEKKADVNARDEDGKVSFDLASCVVR